MEKQKGHASGLHLVLSFFLFFCLFVFVSFFLAVILPWSKKISSDVSSFFQKRETELKKDHWPYQ